MRKGFMFSSDAIFAVIVALSLMLALVSMQQAEKGKEQAFLTTAQKARDKAIIGFYSNNSAQETPNDTKEYYYCLVFARYDPLADSVQQDSSIIKKCVVFP